MKEVDYTDRLHEIKCPMLNVMPGHDPLGVARPVRGLQEARAALRIHRYDGLPHNITDSVPERCAEDLLRFLLKHRAS